MPSDNHTAGVAARDPSLLALVLNKRIVASVADIPATQWDALASATAGATNPFLRHAFLLALQESGCASPQDTGWQAQYLLWAGREPG
jgi:predicted N-acyltransferase